jgi:GntR family transcriptional regulator
VPEPAYRRVAARLRREIASGQRPPGSQLPTYPELAEQLGVSVTTARNAVMELVRGNLVYTATSRGTIVRDRRVLDFIATAPLRPDRPRTGTDVWMETVERTGRRASKSFDMHIEPASAEVALMLDVPVESWVVVRRLVQYLDDEPWSYEVSHYPRDIAEATGIDSPHDIEEGTTRRLRERGYAEVGWTDLNIARPATPDEADALGINPGTYISDLKRIGATTERITRVTRTRRVADRNRVVYEIGDDSGLGIIEQMLDRMKEAEL